MLQCTLPRALALPSSRSGLQAAGRRCRPASLRCSASAAGTNLELLRKDIDSAKQQARSIDGEQNIPLSAIKPVFDRAVAVEEALGESVQLVAGLKELHAKAEELLAEREELSAKMKELLAEGEEVHAETKRLLAERKELCADKEPLASQQLAYLVPSCEVILIGAVLLLLVELDIVGLH
ncbi:hypothetical protein ABPG75_006903 [Micractinium tetrahymenae]